MSFCRKMSDLILKLSKKLDLFNKACLRFSGPKISIICSKKQH
ncbi:hypothetical protein ECDEC8E_3852 [Escherichia coli DEC8E]|nr:hypothetical protein ECDEC8E_3852 [Escherichia coli DEC8E]